MKMIPLLQGVPTSASESAKLEMKYDDFLDVILHPIFYLKRLGDWTLPPSSGNKP
jgi:hypothetical protein